ncbi:MAG: NUDIX domain-containing protein [Leadbetterella sp.]|nr:NUDIX domain-containing protein [Leadbetterella sp.]
MKAAGGVVENASGRILMMKRLGFWDLPKGKAEKGEKSEITAIREVEEECNITVFAERKLATTWHTYFQKGKLVIKRTKWYGMKLISDSKMKPQKEEGIEELAWMGPAEVEAALKMSYRSIIYVLDNYRDKAVAVG